MTRASLEGLTVDGVSVPKAPPSSLQKLPYLHCLLYDDDGLSIRQKLELTQDLYLQFFTSR